MAETTGGNFHLFFQGDDGDWHEIDSGSEPPKFEVEVSGEEGDADALQKWIKSIQGSRIILGPLRLIEGIKTANGKYFILHRRPAVMYRFWMTGVEICAN